MKPNPMPFLLLKIYAVGWIIVGAFYLSAGIVALLQGKFEFHILTFGLIIGIGLLRQSHAAWESTLGLASGFLAVLVFLFFIFITSDGFDFGSSVVTMSWDETDFAKIPNSIFFPVSFCLLAGQIWLLLYKPNRHSFSDKTGVHS